MEIHGDERASYGNAYQSIFFFKSGLKSSFSLIIFNISSQPFLNTIKLNSFELSFISTSVVPTIFTN